MTPAVFALRQALKAIRKEIASEPPFSVENIRRHAELDQLRDMLTRRDGSRDRVLEQDC